MRLRMQLVLRPFQYQRAGTVKASGSAKDVTERKGWMMRIIETSGRKGRRQQIKIPIYEVSKFKVFIIFAA